MRATAGTGLVNAFFKRYWPLLPALLIFSLLSAHLQFTQDDAYITYRYVANFVNGDGLVFNIGERIEGFTNFGWTVLLLLWGVLGFDFILLSKIIGFAFGAGVVIVTYLIACEVLEDKSRWYAAAAVFLLGINQSLAYWSPAGLETAAFAFFAMLSLYLYLRRSWLLIFTLVIAVWLRPEGAIVTGILILTEAISERRVPRFTFTCAAIAFLLCLPFVIFKIAYYGSVFPNPFYAKTSFDSEQLLNGLEYAGRYFRHYGFWGAGFLVPLLFYRVLNRRARAVWLFAAIYLLYIVAIGGDALKVHRFFLPLFGPASILIVLSLWLLVRHWRKDKRHATALCASVLLIFLTYFLPRSYVEQYNYLERAFTLKMQFKARQMLRADRRDFSVAISTIGIFGYELVGHKVIDLVGLTDSTIARYSEEPVAGMATTWKEQKHNSRYLLEKAPDYIVFSTGIKPSAPAERALLLYRQFTDCYRTVGWYYVNPLVGGRGVITSAFKKVRPVTGEIEPFYPVEYVQLYKLGLDAHVRGDYSTALKYYNRAIEASPSPYYIYMDYQKAFSLLKLRQPEASEKLLNAILARDSTVFEAHQDLYLMSLLRRDLARAALHRSWLLKLVPWHWPLVRDLGQRQLYGLKE